MIFPVETIDYLKTFQCANLFICSGFLRLPDEKVDDKIIQLN